ncbi:thioredoxin [Muribaculum intestinale]|jgi:thioredoxin 1|uniref:thioredoxin n=1 Tax=Muribaculum intestinale TaxID=1796646 RepID=UPI0012B73031|nr:thioredoxin [Muribaculum intestinale]
MAIQFTDENVNDYIASSRPTLIDCWATWCGPCVRMSPIIDEVADEFGDKANIGKYNVDEESDLSQQFRIMSIPTILFFKDGKLVDRLAGSQSKATLVDKLNSML